MTFLKLSSLTRQPHYISAEAITEIMPPLPDETRTVGSRLLIYGSREIAVIETPDQILKMIWERSP